MAITNLLAPRSQRRSVVVDLPDGWSWQGQVARTQNGFLAAMGGLYLEEQACGVLVVMSELSMEAIKARIRLRACQFIRERTMVPVPDTDLPR